MATVFLVTTQRQLHSCHRTRPADIPPAWDGNNENSH